MSKLNRFDEIVMSSELECRQVLSQGDDSIEQKAKELAYDENQNYDQYFFQRNVLSKKYSESSKVNFLNDCLDKQNLDFLKYVVSIRSSVYLSEAKLAAFMCDYFENLDAKSPDESHHLLRFTTLNQLPNSQLMIEKYWQQRQGLEKKYTYESELPLQLFRLGEPVAALKLLKELVLDHEEGKIKYLMVGSAHSDEDLFSLLGCCGDESISSQAIDLGFKYFKNAPPGSTYSLQQFLQYVDAERFNDGLCAWYKHFLNSDLTDRKNASNYMRLTAGGNSNIIAKTFGMQYWLDFEKNLSLWPASRLDEDCLNIALNTCDAGISDEDKYKIIQTCLAEVGVLKDDEYKTNDRLLRRFIELVVSRHPNINNEEIDAFIPSKYKKEWTQTWIRPKYNQMKSKPDGAAIESAFVEAGLLSETEDKKYLRFKSQLGSLPFYHYLDATQKVERFDGEAGFFPVDYSSLFYSQIQPLMIANDIADPYFYETQHVTDKGCRYALRCKIGEHSYEVTFDDNSDWYNVSAISQIINRCLHDLGTKLRLVTIDSGDQTALLALFNPDEIVPVLEFCGVPAWATNSRDGFMDTENIQY